MVVGGPSATRPGALDRLVLSVERLALKLQRQRCSQKLDGNLVRKIVYKLKKNNTCAKDDIVGEMLELLGEEVFDVLVDAFKLHLLNIFSNFICKS